MCSVLRATVETYSCTEMLAPLTCQPNFLAYAKYTHCLRGPTTRFDKSCPCCGCRTTCDTALKLPAMDQDSLPLFKNVNACVRHKVLSVPHYSYFVQRTYDLAL